jgi:hypothetical protein
MHYGKNMLYNAIICYTYIIGICFPEFLCRKKGLYTYDADFFLMDVQCGPPKRDVNIGLDSPLQNTIVICVP